MELRVKKDGYYEGNGYKVSWCVGHLVQMSNPDKYDEKYAKWNLSDLPIIPSEYKYEVSKSTQKQFNILKMLMMEDSAIRDGFNHLKDGSYYDDLFESAKARAIADWLVGMNISRFYSCLYKQNYTSKIKRTNSC